jgi:hypothetical protein
VDVGPSPPFDQIKGVIEHTRGGQSFEIFLHSLDAPWKSDYQRVSYGSNYWS